MKKESIFNSRRILVLFLLMLAGGAIYELPYLRYYYYDALQALGLNNTAYGTLMSAYGITAMICYFPGGWLADKISCKKLMVFALFATAALGFYSATFPSYSANLIIYILWGVTTSLVFWAAMLKATRMAGGSEIQGKLFGLLEGGRGLLPMLWGVGILWLFNYLGGEIAGIRGAIIAYSCVVTVAALLLLFFFKETKVEDISPEIGGEKHHLFKEIFYVLKIPDLWLLAIIIFCCYTLYCTQSYITPYFTEMFAASASLAALIALMRTYFIAIFAGPIAGIWADKKGSSARVLRIAILVATLAVLAYLVIPAEASFLWLATAAMVVLAFSVFLTRGVYFAVVDELMIPLQYTGVAIGLASFIGFIPEAFVYTLVGHWMDTYPGITGYKIMFGYMLTIGMLGFIVTMILISRIKKRKAAARQEEGVTDAA